MCLLLLCQPLDAGFRSPSACCTIHPGSVQTLKSLWNDILFGQCLYFVLIMPLIKLLPFIHFNQEGGLLNKVFNKCKKIECEFDFGEFELSSSFPNFDLQMSLNFATLNDEISYQFRLHPPSARADFLSLKNENASNGRRRPRKMRRRAGFFFCVSFSRSSLIVVRSCSTAGRP